MGETAERTRLILTRESRPLLPRHIKLRHDKGRDRWVILAPERVFNPDPIAVSVLKHCDGNRSVESIAALLVAEYASPLETVRTDILELLQDLADKGVVAAAA